jgi:amino acid permease
MLDCFRVVIVLFATLVVLPLSLKRSLQDLKWSSTISVTMLTYLTVTLGIIGVAKFLQEGIPQHVNFFRGGMHALIGVDIVVFSFHCHIQV